jgi:LysR family transcriptional regulator, flagellar master operon regulator
MNVMQAKTFLELVAVRNFNKAAERLGVTQSCVTLRIKSLEEMLGQQLFIRTKAGVELSVAGRRLQPYAESLVQVWQQARKELALPPDITTMLSLGCDPGLWHGYVSDWLKALRSDQPAVALEIEVRHSAYLIERLAQGLLHAAVVYEPHLHHGIVVEPLFEEKLVLVTREPRKRVRWHPRYVLVQWTAEFRAQHDAVMPVDITPPVVFADGVFALDFILRSGGSGYFPLRMIIDHLKRGQLFYVSATRVMNCNAHLAYSEPLLNQPWFKQARAQLLAMCEAQCTLVHDYIDNGAIEQWTGLPSKSEPMPSRAPNFTEGTSLYDQP